MFDLFHLVRGHDDRLVLVEVVFQQVLVELLAIEDVQAQRGFVQDQQLGVDRHYQRQMQLHDHALGHLPHALVGRELGARQERLALGAIETRVHVGDEIDHFVHADPAWQYRHIGDEADIAHQLVTLLARVETQHVEITREIGEAEDRLQRGGLAGTVGADQSDDPTGSDLETDVVQRQGRLVPLAQAAGRDHRAHDCSPLAD